MRRVPTRAPFEDVRSDLKLDEAARDGGRPGPIARARLALARPLLAMRRAPRLGRDSQTTPWRVLVARIASARPVAIAIALVTIAGLVAAASGLRSTELGLTFISGLPESSEAKQAADAASEGFAPGVLAPTEVDLIAPGIADSTPELSKSGEPDRSAAGRRRGRRTARATARPLPAGDGLRRRRRCPVRGHPRRRSARRTRDRHPGLARGPDAVAAGRGRRRPARRRSASGDRQRSPGRQSTPSSTTSSGSVSSPWSPTSSC